MILNFSVTGNIESVSIHSYSFVCHEYSYSWNLLCSCVGCAAGAQLIKLHLFAYYYAH